MKKRIVCVLLTLIMLVSLVPAAALTASAATKSTSEAAITVLKQMEGYSKNCANGYIGYGTKCPECNLKETGGHVMYEKIADQELREALADLDKAVGNFASKNGLGLTQGQHDALVLFSFENGTAWTTGTGEFQTAVKSGATGSKFLNAICLWESGTADDYRRMVEANMYLNGTYSSAEPSRFVRIKFDTNGGKLSASEYQYFDAATPQQITLAPTMSDDVFLGWYRNGEFKDEDGNKYNADVRVSHVTTDHKRYGGETLELKARWQNVGGQQIKYTISKSSLLSTTVYSSVGGGKVTKYADINDKEVVITLGNTLNVIDDQIDKDGVRWARIADADGAAMGWVKVKGTGNTANTGSSAAEGVIVTVTNSYVNMRKNASITSTKNGSFTQGTELVIIDTKNGSDGFLWGQVAQSATDSTPIGWVALMYTNYESVKNSGSTSSSTVNNSTVVATAIITYPGYVNLRSDAGTHNQIVGSLANGYEVDLYETKYVNGVEWGRCNSGWFCLIYADVTRLVQNNSAISDVGYTNYVFTGDLDEDLLETALHEIFRVAPNGDMIEEAKDKKGNVKVLETVDVTFSNLINQDGETWVKTSYGWIEMSKITMDVAKFYVIADSLTVRDNYATSAARVDVLIKGTEFDVNQIVLVGDTIWGYANKVGEVEDPTYSGWVNLANKNVSRNGAPTVAPEADKDPAAPTKIATVINTESVRVRKTGATYGTVLGSLSRGTTAAILEEKNGWYNLDIDVDGDPSTGSWVSGKYLEITTGTVNGSTTDSTGAVVTGKGIVANTYAGVNVRTGAGTGNAAVGKLLPGTVVEILEVKTHGASKWGRTEQGWVCMDYIVMVDNYVPEGSVSSGSSNTTTNSTSMVAIYTGVTADDVNIYKEPTLNNPEIVRESVPAGYPVTMHEIVTVTEVTEIDDSESGKVVTTETTTYWARVNEGYIENPQENINLIAEDESTYTVTGSDILNVREEAGTSGTKVYQLKKGDQVIVNDYTVIGNNIWGHIEADSVKRVLEDEEGNEYVDVDWSGEGWVSLSYMSKGAITIQTESNNTNNNTGSNTNNSTGNSAPVIGSTGNTTTGGFVTNTSGYKYTGKIINTNEVNVRPTASTTGTPTTTLKNGAALVIYETTISEGMAWGRCDAGWVYLYYVDLTPVSNGAVDARVVYNDNTIIYTDMNCSGVAGTYSKMSVIDIYEIVGKMARTEQGWVNTDNLL